MSGDNYQTNSTAPWALNTQGGSVVPYSVDLDSSRTQQSYATQTRHPYHAPASNVSRQTERVSGLTRSSTLGPPETDRSLAANVPPHALSEDLNHTSISTSFAPGSSPRPSPHFLSTNGSSRPSTPSAARKSSHPSSSGNTDTDDRLGDLVYDVDSAAQGAPCKLPPIISSSSASLTSTPCSACGKFMQGPFVRALGNVYHLSCFKCLDCGDVVASKFFPIDGPDGKHSPLCERDYFKRLNLICAKCGMALRGSYITACNKKYHVEHFTCSLCPTLFGPQDSYYEHDGDVYCHFHYSTRFATKCVGCNSAILKQFVEINRNSRDECWHPECYMINKFWNVKVCSRRPTSATSAEGDAQPAYITEEQRETPSSLREKQVRMEQQVYRIWTVLSAFEESSAACISDMLRQVSNGQYLEAIRMAEKFILHVEVLFATIDDLEFHFARLVQKGMSHVREARMLCRKTVELFTLLSHTQETGARRMGMTQELLALVTGLAHYLKILIRIALTGALRLEREQSVRDAMASFLDKLHLLAVQGGNPAARRLLKGSNGEVVATSPHQNHGTQSVTYGFRSLAPENAGESPFTLSAHRDGKPSSNPPSDLCVKCGLTVEEDCVRLGTYQRWHSHCIECAVCGKVAAVPLPKEPAQANEDKDGANREQPQKPSTVRRPPANVGSFVYNIDSLKETTSFGEVPNVILCTAHAHSNCRGGFVAVHRLEQYAFLLNVALRRLYLLLKKQGVVPLSPTPTGQPQSDSNLYRNSGDIMRMKSVHLDRKLSATARLPKRSTIVESPTGRTVHPSDVVPPNKQPESHPSQPQTSSQNHLGQPTPPQQYLPIPFAASSRPSLASHLSEHSIQGQILRPAFSRTNEVKIVDESMPSSPAGGAEDNPMAVLDDGITLADIPQIMEAAQAREQQRSLPRENSIPYIAELSALELAIVKHAAVLSLSKSPLKDQIDLDELLELVEAKKSGFWNKLFKADKKNIKKKGVFGVPLELLVERDGADSLLGATRATMRVPSFIDDVISAMRQMDMSIEGIFRKNGNIRRLKELTEAIDRDPSSVDLTQDNPVQLAALLKKFLRELPDPLMTFKLHRLFIASQSLPTEEERNRYLHLISILMPKSHRDTMEVLFVFLKWVASFAHMDAETGSKMDLSNLATVICPNILYARGQNAVRDDTFGALRVVTNFLENQDEFFAVPSEFLPILHDQEYFSNSMDLPGKEFMKKCDTYFKIKATNGRLLNPNHVNGTPSRHFPPNLVPPDRPVISSQVSGERQRTPQSHSTTLQGINGQTTLTASPFMQAMNTPRIQQMEEGPVASRPSIGPSTPRPTSYAVQRPSSDHGHAINSNMSQANANGYPPTVRQPLIYQYDKDVYYATYDTHRMYMQDKEKPYSQKPKCADKPLELRLHNPSIMIALQTPSQHPLTVPANAPEHCPGTDSAHAGKTDACAGCANQEICASGKTKGPDPALPFIRERMSTVRRKIVVLSGKGGVGKSTFAAQLAWAFAADEQTQTAVMDVDICGPSIPTILGIASEQVHVSSTGWSPVYVQDNLGVMSVGFMLPTSRDAVMWRGPKKNGLISQFLKDVDWGDLDYLVIDTPPGTSDEHLSVTQYLKESGIDGAILVTTPQEVALQDVRREINFCRKVGIRILGIVENMSGFVCPKCKTESQVFKPSTGGARALAEQTGVELLGTIPLDPRIGKSADFGSSFIDDYPDSPATQMYMSIIERIKTLVETPD